MVFCSKWCSAQSGVLLNLGGVLLKVVFCSESGVLVNIHYASSAEWGFGFDSSSYGPTVGCVTNILVVALLPDKEWPTVVCRDLHVCSAAVFGMVSM